MLAYHILHANAAHGTGLDAIKGGAKHVALLLDHPPMLAERNPSTLALKLVGLELLPLVELPMNS